MVVQTLDWETKYKTSKQQLRIQHFVYLTVTCRGGSERGAKFLQESILIVFDFIWEVLVLNRNFATLLDPTLI